MRRRSRPIAIEALRRRRPSRSSCRSGFFETHRDFAAPTSVRDSLYSLPPPNLPDEAEDPRRHGRVQGERPLAGPGHRRGAQRPAPARAERAHADHLHDRPRPRVPEAKATLVRPRHRGDDDHARAGRVHGRQGLRQIVSQLDVYPTLCELRRASRRPGLRPGPLADAARPRRDGAHPRRGLRRVHLPRRVRAPALRCARIARSTSAGSAATPTPRWQLRRLRHEGRARRGRLGRALGRARAALRPGLRPPRGAQPRRRRRSAPTCSPTCAGAWTAG